MSRGFYFHVVQNSENNEGERFNRFVKSVSPVNMVYLNYFNLRIINNTYVFYFPVSTVVYLLV